LTELTNNQSKQAHALDEVGSGKGQDFPSRRDGNVERSLQDGSNVQYQMTKTLLCGVLGLKPLDARLKML
jgi:hypothetical protein